LASFAEKGIITNAKECMAHHWYDMLKLAKGLVQIRSAQMYGSKTLATKWMTKTRGEA